MAAAAAIFQDGKAPLDLWQVVQQIDQLTPHDTIITNGAGNYATWAHRFHSYGGMRTQLAPTSGAMGYSVPAGVAAKIIDPARTVITFAGDGEYMMNGQELATAVQYRPAWSSLCSTTPCSAPSACTRSASIRAACRAPRCTILTLRRWPWPTAAW
jgi:thiamine pyrophosphate-dependent acetolactate synthase large subunit-like protein